MADSDQERTEQATGKRRADFRQKGQVAQSKEVHTAALMTGTLLLWTFYAPLFWRTLSDMLHHLWSLAGDFEVTPVSAVMLLGQLGQKIALLLAPIMLTTLVIGILSSYLQVGWLFTTKPLAPDFSKMNPVPGLAKLISKRSFIEVVKSLLKVFLVGVVAYKVILAEFGQALDLVDMDINDSVVYLARVAARILLRTCGVMILLALLDFLFVRWEMEQKMKMTKQEQKEEHKESEGDPQIKARIRSMQMQAARRRMMAEVPKADVVITNPTHLSVALAYDRSRMSAPQIVAKGADAVAMRIREIAREHKVPLVENKPVARVLFKVDLGKDVPEEMFQAVAEILAYVYGLKKR
ncbi:flagellar biogenesis protein FlhB [Syntrophotalea carbinolica DSM 2380]|uniref:Flagellar biosynthetic protein FlhB n=1 Tax=Syntrophotalea carbinolica (strain DSM 2380 / NBRC 103641 / GraBd1) TaxID=338963 RepID=Q3A5E5_SYNC1|nr:flagellar biosynthesis protein FlhB [Syntrophotalea carbinolica]ABA88412.1 flagellar biogenesis protein FlhB [Syntrophotalea carbinolica DSM 2380]